MKSLLLVAMGLLLISSVASAELITDNELGGPANVLPSRACDPPAVEITQNLGFALDTGCFSCGNTFYSYVIDCVLLRRFSLYWDYGVENLFSIQTVDWGVRRFVATDSVLPAGTVVLPWNPLDPDFMVDVNLYSVDANLALTWTNMGAPFATKSEWIQPEPFPSPLILNRPMHTVFGQNCVYDPFIDPIYNDLVVAIHSPETYTMITPHRFSLSANTLLDTQLCYVAWPVDDCNDGNFNPMRMDSIGTGSAVVMVVCGQECVPPPPTGACCNIATGACSITEEIACPVPANTWHPEWLACLPDNPCPQPATGACCNIPSGACSITILADCPLPLNIWHPEWTCVPDNCPKPDPLGACCNIATGDCSITTAGNCPALFNIWHPEWLSCVPNFCPPPVPTETKSWGQVKSLYR
jgi:hypothetical protein